MDGKDRIGVFSLLTILHLLLLVLIPSIQAVRNADTVYQDLPLESSTRSDTELEKQDDFTANLSVCQFRSQTDIDPCVLTSKCKYRCIKYENAMTGQCHLHGAIRTCYCYKQC
eukprot:c16054_g1_i1 orf=97-435(+)